MSDPCTMREKSSPACPILAFAARVAEFRQAGIVV